jgi:hypothetical protein
MKEIEINKIEADHFHDKTSSWKKYYKTGKIDTIGWGFIFIWGGIILLADITEFGANFSWWDSWAVFFTGFGIIALIGGLISLKFRDKDKAGWNFIISFIILGFSLSTLLNAGWIIVLIPLAIGIIIIIGAFIDKSEIKDFKKYCFDGD